MVLFPISVVRLRHILSDKMQIDNEKQLFVLERKEKFAEYPYIIITSSTGLLFSKLLSKFLNYKLLIYFWLWNFTTHNFFVVKNATIC